MRAKTRISRRPSHSSDHTMHIIQNGWFREKFCDNGTGRGNLSPFLSWSRPDSYWDVVVAHLPLALITGIALLLPHLISCDLLPLKECTFLSLTGYPCPFCGFTRSFWAIAEGDWGFAVNNAPLACLTYIATVLLFAWHITALLIRVRVVSGLFHLLKSFHAGWLIVAMLVLNWAYRLGLGLK